MIHRGTYDGTIYYNPANKFCIISVKTAEKDVPEEARSIRRRKDHLIRFVATGYELPRTDAVELELDGEWKKGKYGMQLQVEQWHEIVPQTKSGVEGYDSMVRVSRLIEQLSASGVIVFVVSHDFEFIVRTCTEVVQLDDQGAVQNHRLTPQMLKALSEQYFH